MEMYTLAKAIWTEVDFSQMGWHDATVWGLLANPATFEYLLDLDYIFQWVHPKADETAFRFWVAPVTMVFQRAHEIKIDIDSPQGIIEIADLQMEESRLAWNTMLTEHLFSFECREGCLSLWAIGFHMFVRRAPVLR